MRKFAFSRSARISVKKDFDGVFAARIRLRVSPLLVRARKRSGAQQSRLGLAVPRKYGNACRRNRLKRLIREAFRLNRGLLRSHFDIVVSPTMHSGKPAFAQVEKALLDIFHQLNEMCDSENPKDSHKGD